MSAVLKVGWPLALQSMATAPAHTTNHVLEPASETLHENSTPILVYFDKLIC